MNILLLGSGGREHAIAYKLAQSTHCSKLYVAPGNAGMDDVAEPVNLSLSDFNGIEDFAINHSVEMIVVGPEAPLVDGIVDHIAGNPHMKHVMVIGPSQKGAQLEGSKEFAKQFMQRHAIPTARYKAFTRETLQEGFDFLATLQAPYVLKADGLAAGKGVLILPTLEQAQQELQQMLEGEKFGEASRTVVVEEFLSGIELSVFVLTDGKHYKILPAAKDYKRVGEGDTGLNTGGMGSISPVPFADSKFMRKVEQRIVAPTVKGLAAEKIPYKGFIFIGLMNVDGEPYVIEYNVRMGDPETEVVFPRIKNDVVNMLKATWDGMLQTIDLDIDKRTAACVVLTSGGYPEAYRKGYVISGVEDVEGSTVFHAGTDRNAKGDLVNKGGRVLAITSMAATLPEALLKSFQAADKINWTGKYYRRDIGQDLLNYSMSHPEE